jgi:succinate dehydrogenase / fumarate reductase cytochrome b subunit
VDRDIKFLYLSTEIQNSNRKQKRFVAGFIQIGVRIMESKEIKKTGGGFWNWFDPRNRQPGTWAFILNRVTGLGLTLYLFLHLIVLGLLAQGPDAFNTFIKLASSPIFLFGELLVVAAGIIHGLNGIRIGLTTFGVGVSKQKQMFYVFFAIAIVLSLFFAVVMFRHSV